MGGTPQGGRSGRMVGVLLALLLTAAACGSDNPSVGGTGSRDGPTGSAVGSVDDPATGGSTTGTGDGVVTSSTVDDDAETIEDLEAAWAARRASVVTALSAEQLGVDEGGTLVGPNRFSVDLSACPEGWLDASGVDDTTIKIGITAPQSGEQAAFNEITLGMRAYFDWVNARGGIDGRQIQLIIKDDGYDPARTVTAVQELLAFDAPLYVTSVGSPGGLAVYGALNTACVPQPFVASSHPAWGDPENHPWTSGLQMSLTTEAIMWGNWIKQHLAGEVPVTVAALVIDNDFGQIYADSFQAWAAANRDIVSEVTVVRHDPAAVTVLEEMTTIAEAAPEVFLVMTTGEACASAIDESGKLGLNRTALVRFTPSGCTQPVTFMSPAGDGADGFYAVGPGLVSNNDPAYARDTFVAFVNSQLAGVGLDPTRELVGVGFGQYGWAHVELLRIAAALPGGLTRSNVVLAMRGSNLDHPMVMDGVRFATNGLGDAYFVEGAAFNRYDAAARAWYPQGPPVDLNGASPTCGWERGACRR